MSVIVVGILGRNYCMKRPAVFICGFYLLGLLIGYYMQNIHMVGGLFICIIILSIILYKTYSWKALLLFPLICFFAYLNICGLEANRSSKIDEVLNSSALSHIEGYIKDISYIDDKVQFIIKANRILIDSAAYTDKSGIKVYGSDVKDLSIGDYVNVSGSLTKLDKPRNPGQFDEEKYYLVRGIKYKLFLKNYEVKKNHQVPPDKLVYTVSKVLYRLRMRAMEIYDRLLPQNQANLMKAMILGEKSYLSLDTKNKYSESGISHVLAISGLHIAIIGYGFSYAIGLLVSRKKAVTITIGFLVFYCLFTGASVSTVRAVIMLAIILMAYFFGRTYDIVSSISTAAFILLVINPYYLWDVGFLLSFSAVLGIVMLVPALNTLNNKSNNPIIGIFNASLAATLGTMPVMVYNFYDIHIYSVLVNMLVVPLMSIVVLFGFIGLVLGSVSLLVGKIFSGIIFYILGFYDFCSEVVTYLPFHTITIGRPKLINLVLFIILLLLIAMLAHEKAGHSFIKKRILLLFSVSIVMNAIFLIMPKPLKVVHLDIGQGDSTVIISPNKEVYVVDGGGTRKKNKTDRDTGYYILRPYLKYNGIDKIDCLIMTHSDRDHIGGLIELMDYFKVDKLIVPSGYKNKEDSLLEELINKANKNKVAVFFVSDGNIINGRDITLETLYPLKGITIFHNNNAHSLVLKVKYKSFTALLTGDIEQQEEQMMNQTFADGLKSDIMKVPHHGSKTSSTEAFINNVMPKIAIISCGRDNRYGHPHEVVERYMNRQIPIFNTSVDGAITIKTDGSHMGISTYYSKKQQYIECK